MSILLICIQKDFYANEQNCAVLSVSDHCNIWSCSMFSHWESTLSTITLPQTLPKLFCAQSQTKPHLHHLLTMKGHLFFIITVSFDAKWDTKVETSHRTTNRIAVKVKNLIKNVYSWYYKTITGYFDFYSLFSISRLTVVFKLNICYF